MASQTSEFFQFDPSYNIIIATNSMGTTAANSLQQGLGRYISQEDAKLCFYDGGKCLLKVDTSNKEDVNHAVRAFTRYNGLTDYRSREQLQSLVNDYIRMSR